MITRTTTAEHRLGSGRTARFEGEPYGSQVSFFAVDVDPGQGPVLHRHPYSETWVVVEGEATVTADGEEHHASAGDILVVGPGTAHKFRATGTGPLRMVCIHAAPRMQQEDLE